MKAYQAWDTRSVEECSTVVVGETAQGANGMAFNTQKIDGAAGLAVRGGGGAGDGADVRIYYSGEIQ